MQPLRAIAVSIGVAMIADSDVFCQIPVPTFPQDQGTMQTFDALRWTAVTGATSYDVTMSTNPGFTALYNYTGLTTTSYAPGSLRSGQQYFWTVRAHVGAVIGAWSDTVSF